MAIKYCLLTNNGTSGAYWNTLSNDQKARYFDGSYQVFSRMFDFYDVYIKNKQNLSVDLVLEIQGAWTDTYANYTAGASLNGFKSIKITTTINGVRDPASFHYGKIGSGYVLVWPYANSNVIRSNNVKTIIDGIEINNTLSSTGIYITTSDGIVKNCIITVGGISGTGPGIFCAGAPKIYNNLIYNVAFKGIILQGYMYGAEVYNNTIIGCGIGIDAKNTYLAFINNNAIFGCTTNWGTAPDKGFFSNNTGTIGDIIWDSNNSAKIITSSDFKNYVNPITSAADFSPSGNSLTHTSTSLLVDAGSDLFLSNDIKDATRPSYNNGVLTNPDIGAFEFDWGYGEAPLNVLLSFSGISDGSVLAVYKTSDKSEIISPITIGATGKYSMSFVYINDTQIIIKVRKGTSGTRYLPYEAPGLITSSGYSLIVNQVEDTIAELI